MKLIFICFFLFLLSPSVAQNFVKVAEFESPLKRKSNNYYKIEKDKNNFYWLYTIEGLFRFDGTNFENRALIKSQKIDSLQCFDSSQSYFNFPENRITEIRTEKSKLLQLSTELILVRKQLNLSVKESFLFHRLIRKNKLFNNSFLDSINHVITNSNGFHFILTDGRIFYMDINGNISNILLTNKSNLSKIISINKYTILFNFESKTYLVIYQNKILNINKLAHVNFIDQLMHYTVHSNFDHGLPFFSNDSLYLFSINKQAISHFSFIGKLNKPSKFWNFFYDIEQGILFITYFNGKIEKYVKVDKNFKTKKQFFENVVVYNHICLNNEVFNNSQIVSKYFKFNYKNWHWNYNSASCMLPNKKILYYIRDSLYILSNNRFLYNFPKEKKTLGS